MKKYLALAAGMASLGVFAEGANADVTVVTNMITTIQSYIETAMTAAWPIITAIVGIGLLVWLGRVLIRAVRSYFSTAM